MGVSSHRHAVNTLHLENRGGTRCTGGWVRSSGAGPDESRKPPPPPLGIEPRTVQPVPSRYTENFTILDTNIIHARSVFR
jgi:hypothetical protein